MATAVVTHDLDHALKGVVVSPACPPAWQAPMTRPTISSVETSERMAPARLPVVAIGRYCASSRHHLEALRLDVYPGRTEGFEKITLG